MVGINPNAPRTTLGNNQGAANKKTAGTESTTGTPAVTATADAKTYSPVVSTSWNQSYTPTSVEGQSRTGAHTRYNEDGDGNYDYTYANDDFYRHSQGNYKTGEGSTQGTYGTPKSDATGSESHGRNGFGYYREGQESRIYTPWGKTVVDK